MKKNVLSNINSSSVHFDNAATGLKEVGNHLYNFLRDSVLIGGNTLVGLFVGKLLVKVGILITVLTNDQFTQEDQQEITSIKNILHFPLLIGAVIGSGHNIQLIGNCVKEGSQVITKTILSLKEGILGSVACVIEEPAFDSMFCRDVPSTGDILPENEWAS